VNEELNKLRNGGIIERRVVFKFYKTNKSHIDKISFKFRSMSSSSLGGGLGG
jgi:hypothetical protein